MKAKTVAGFVLSCVGDDRAYSLLRSRLGNTPADKAAMSVLKSNHPDYVEYSFLERGSDERQYGAPGIDLPVASIMRTKYGMYPEYHTSLDDLTLVTPSGLQEAFEIYRQVILALEKNKCYKVQCLGEPQLGKRGLYPTISQKGTAGDVRTLMNVLAYCDGGHDLFDLSDKIGVAVSDIIPIIEKLKDAQLIEENTTA